MCLHNSNYPPPPSCLTIESSDKQRKCWGGGDGFTTPITTMARYFLTKRSENFEAKLFPKRNFEAKHIF